MEVNAFYINAYNFFIVLNQNVDIGADKQADYFHLEKEDNLALGYRAIRICLKEPEIFKTQLRALLRAASFGNISIMYPMITSVEEVQKIFGIVDEVRRKLEYEQIPHKVPEQGIMIETPAVVMINDELAEIVRSSAYGVESTSGNKRDKNKRIQKIIS